LTCIGVGVLCGAGPTFTYARTLPRGGEKSENDFPQAALAKKLVLKDGNYQLVREYQRNGDRVRYFSAERGDWEEIPAAMVDWAASAKAESAATASKDELLKKVHQQEEQQRTEAPMDVDASLPVAPGVFLPPGEGMFVVEGKSVTPLDQATAEIHTDKKQL